MDLFRERMIAAVIGAAVAFLLSAGFTWCVG